MSDLSYDSNSENYQLEQTCCDSAGSTDWYWGFPDGQRILIDESEAKLTATVTDNHQVVDGGSFELKAQIDQLGILTNTTIVTGSRVDVWYGVYITENGARSKNHVQNLIKIDYVIPQIEDLVDDYIMWASYNVGDFWCNTSGIPCPWTGDVDKADQSTHNEFWFLGSSYKVPEPSTFGLFSAGLLGLGFMRRNRQQV